ncbi:MAG: hypothetical protein HBSIN02_09750 [Bacteroidia bacterium]|nr:MAG: hypothetical protein HBSIN02_09750 [Bacteroidia bacterium]
MSLLVLMVAVLVTQEGGNVLKARIQKRLSESAGTYAVAFEDLQSGRRVLMNEREMFHAASTMKTPVMIELFKKAEDGEITLDDSIEVRNSFRSIVDGSPYSLSVTDDSDDSAYALLGRRVTIRQLIAHMITVSSNLATNILIELANPAQVTRTMRTLGADSIQVLRGVEDLKAFERGWNNRTTAYDLLMIFRAIAGGSVPGSAAMMDILEQQQFKDLIPAGLPAGVRVAHKTGSISGVEHDGGIVILPDGRRYILVVLSRDVPDREEGKKTIADVSRIVFEYMTGS